MAVRLHYSGMRRAQAIPLLGARVIGKMNHAEFKESAFYYTPTYAVNAPI